MFFADLTEEGQLWEDVEVGADDRVSVVHIPPGATVEPLPTPRRPRSPVLRRRRVRLRPVLTLPERPVGVSAAERLGYEALYLALVELTPGLERPGHLVLGHPAVTQEDPRSPDQVNVFHIGWDEALGFEFLDGGDLTFFGDAADVEAGRWDRLTVSPSSC